MKKIVSIITLFFVLIAFSGVVSAVTVTDKGTKTIKYDGESLNNAKVVWSYSLIHYSSTHIVFQTMAKFLFNYGKWQTDYTYKANYDYKKSSNNKIILTKTITKLAPPSKPVISTKKSAISTTKSVYNYFKTQKTNLIKGMNDDV
jgi:hypothetical protein